MIEHRRRLKLPLVAWSFFSFLAYLPFRRFGLDNGGPTYGFWAGIVCIHTIIHLFYYLYWSYKIVDEMAGTISRFLSFVALTLLNAAALFGIAGLYGYLFGPNDISVTLPGPVSIYLPAVLLGYLVYAGEQKI